MDALIAEQAAKLAARQRRVLIALSQSQVELARAMASRQEDELARQVLVAKVLVMNK